MGERAVAVVGAATTSTMGVTELPAGSMQLLMRLMAVSDEVKEVPMVWCRQLLVHREGALEELFSEPGKFSKLGPRLDKHLRLARLVSEVDVPEDHQTPICAGAYLEDKNQLKECTMYLLEIQEVLFHKEPTVVSEFTLRKGVARLAKTLEATMMTLTAQMSVWKKERMQVYTKLAGLQEVVNKQERNAAVTVLEEMGEKKAEMQTLAAGAQLLLTVALEFCSDC